MDIFLARQPIFHSNQQVFAYEILYRSGYTNIYDGSQADRASTEVMVNTFQNFGIDNLTNKKPVFINFTESLICDEVATYFPNDLLVVEILETVQPHSGIIKKCRSLKEQGYKLALDDYVDTPEHQPLVELADIIKMDFLNTDRTEIHRIFQDFQRYEVDFLAEKVETREEFEYARALGFKYFQGYFFSKPEIVKSKKLLPIKSNYIQLIGESNKMELDFKEISKIISRDLSLTYNLLKLVNSVAFGFRYKINKVQHAVAALGEKELKKWIYLLVLNEMGSGRPDELTRLSLIRAKFGEIIANKTRYFRLSEDIFLLGLLSLLDVILQRPLDEVLEEIQATDTIKEVLLEEKGQLNELYQLLIAYEKGEWDQVIDKSKELGLDHQLISNSYMDTLKWYADLVK